MEVIDLLNSKEQHGVRSMILHLLTAFRARVCAAGAMIGAGFADRRSSAQASHNRIEDSQGFPTRPLKLKSVEKSCQDKV